MLCMGGEGELNVFYIIKIAIQNHGRVILIIINSTLIYYMTNAYNLQLSIYVYYITYTILNMNSSSLEAPTVTNETQYM